MTKLFALFIKKDTRVRDLGDCKKLTKGMLLGGLDRGGEGHNPWW